jgi:hypothetical protein
MIKRMQAGPSREQAIKLGLATSGDIDEMIKAWEEWSVTDTATLGIVNGEVVIHKP